MALFYFSIYTKYTDFIQAVLLKRNPDDLKIYKINTDIENPSDFDAFSQSYKCVLSEISEKHKNSQILINISSGTPQMIATACLIASSKYYNNNYKCIQVTNPQKRSGEKCRYIDVFDESMIDNTFDFIEETDSRCLEPDILLFKRSMLLEKFIKLIKVYDYSSALKLNKENNNIFGEKTNRWLEHITARINYDIVNSDKALKADDIVEFDPYPVKNGRFKPLYDFYLGVLVRNLQTDWSAYLLKLSPLLSNMIYYYITEVCKYPLVKSIYYDRGKNTRKLQRSYMQKNDPELLKYMDSCFSGSNFKDGFLMLSNLLPVLEYIIKKQYFNSTYLSDINKKFVFLRDIEFKLRNNVAHEMVKITDDWATKTCGYSFSKIQKELHSLFALIMGNNGQSGWDTLPDRLNSYIININP